MIETYEKLEAAWADILYNPNPSDCDFSLRDVSPLNSEQLNGRTYFGRHVFAWEQLIKFLLTIPPREELSILITAMSVGCELYDAVKIAQDFNLFAHHKNVTFYGHDLSVKFTARAKSSLYPIVKTKHLPVGYFENKKPYDSYVKIHDDLRAHTHILPPSDIGCLSGKYDVVVSNVINPAPYGLTKILNGLARHLMIRTKTIGGISDEFRVFYDQIREAQIREISPLYDIGIRPCLVGFREPVRLLV